MAQKSDSVGRVRLVVKRSSLLMKIVVLAAVVLSIAALTVLGAAIVETKAQAEALRSQAISLEQENSELTEKLENLNTVQGFLQIAKEKLGLVDQDTVIFDPAQ